MIADVLTAKYINQACGGAVIAPWEVSELSDDWIDSTTAIITRLPSYQEGRQKVNGIVDSWKADFEAKYKRKH
jgi:hypothetical protein